MSACSIGHWACCSDPASVQLYRLYVRLGELRVFVQAALLMGPRLPQCSANDASAAAIAAIRAKPSPVRPHEVRSGMLWLLENVEGLANAPHNLVPSEKRLAGKLNMSDPSPPSAALVYLTACVGLCISSGLASQSPLAASSKVVAKLRDLHHQFSAFVCQGCDDAKGCCAAGRCTFANVSLQRLSAAAYYPITPPSMPTTGYRCPEPVRCASSH